MSTITTKTNQEEEDAEQIEMNFFFWLDGNEKGLESLSEDEFIERISKEQKRKQDWLEVNTDGTID